jgi:hypothetical protein
MIALLKFIIIIAFKFHPLLSIVQNGKLSSLDSGGKCQEKAYVEFSHLCEVNNYMPSVDHCCCGFEDVILCCKYHQNWNNFRCAEEFDVIGDK